MRLPPDPARQTSRSGDLSKGGCPGFLCKKDEMRTCLPFSAKEKEREREKKLAGLGKKGKSNLELIDFPYLSLWALGLVSPPSDGRIKFHALNSVPCRLFYCFAELPPELPEPADGFFFFFFYLLHIPRGGAPFLGRLQNELREAWVAASSPWCTRRILSWAAESLNTWRSLAMTARPPSRVRWEAEKTRWKGKKGRAAEWLMTAKSINWMSGRLLCRLSCTAVIKTKWPLCFKWAKKKKRVKHLNRDCARSPAAAAPGAPLCVRQTKRHQKMPSLHLPEDSLSPSIFNFVYVSLIVLIDRALGTFIALQTLLRLIHLFT